jgi:hypothetical protein
VAQLSNSKINKKSGRGEGKEMRRKREKRKEKGGKLFFKNRDFCSILDGGTWGRGKENIIQPSHEMHLSSLPLSCPLSPVHSLLSTLSSPLLSSPLLSSPLLSSPLSHKREGDGSKFIPCNEVLSEDQSVHRFSQIQVCQVHTNLEHRK